VFNPFGCCFYGIGIGNIDGQHKRPTPHGFHLTPCAFKSINSAGNQTNVSAAASKRAHCGTADTCGRASDHHDFGFHSSSNLGSCIAA
jgi:hypothetical protein